ncbi:MAG: helix-turn-helix transcriptional regulator [Janthinobacterium lividum]
MDDMRLLTMETMTKPGMTLINRKRLLSLVPLSGRVILEMERRGDFPRRFAITPRRVAWDLNEVEEWMRTQKTERKQLFFPGTRPMPD